MDPRHAQQPHPAAQAPSPRPHKRGPWSQNEDQYLLYLVSKAQPQNWVRISQEIGTRSAKQCRERYHQNLKPSLNRDTITESEGHMIEHYVKTMGKRWADIARKLHGRSDNQVKNWWNGSMNRRRRAETKRHNEHASSLPTYQQQQQQPGPMVSSPMGRLPPGQLPLPAGQPMHHSSALPTVSLPMDQREERPLHERRYHPDCHFSSRTLTLPAINTNTPRYLYSTYSLESPLPSPASGAPSPSAEAQSVPQSPAYTTSPQGLRDPRSILLPNPAPRGPPMIPPPSYHDDYEKITLPPIASPLTTAPSSPSSVQGQQQPSGQKDTRLALSSLIN